MRVAVELYLEPPTSIGRYLVTLDDRQVLNRFLPVLTSLAADLNITADKCEPRDAGLHVRDRILNIIGKYSGAENKRHC